MERHEGGAGSSFQYSVIKNGLRHENAAAVHIDIVVFRFSKQYNKSKKERGVLL